MRGRKQSLELACGSCRMCVCVMCVCALRCVHTLLCACVYVLCACLCMCLCVYLRLRCTACLCVHACRPSILPCTRGVRPAASSPLHPQSQITEEILQQCRLQHGTPEAGELDQRGSLCPGPRLAQPPARVGRPSAWLRLGARPALRTRLPGPARPPAAGLAVTVPF